MSQQTYEERQAAAAKIANTPAATTAAASLPKRTWKEAGREFAGNHLVLSGAATTVVGLGAYEGIKAGVKFAASKIRRKTTEKVTEDAARALLGGALGFFK